MSIRRLIQTLTIAIALAFGFTATSPRPAYAFAPFAGVLGVKPSDLLGGVSTPEMPHFDLVEARRLLEVGKASEALPMLEQLEEGLTAADQLVRLRYLAAAYNVVGQPKQAFPVIE